jgi:putative transposase
LAGIATKITLTKKQENILKTLSKSRTAPAHFQQRATIILYCSQGKTNIEVMAEMGIYKTTVSKWRTRWARNIDKLTAIENQEHGIAYQRSVEDVLSDLPRSGTPCKFTAEQICQIVNVSCESPEENKLPFSHWSLTSLADELSKRKIVDSISTSQLQVFLKSVTYKTTQN